MQYRQFGKSGITTSVIGLGTWPMGGARYGAVDDAEAARAVEAALDVGITCFDTAPNYGNGHAEEVLARGLGTRRKDAIIVTKGGLIWDEKSYVHGHNSDAQWLETNLETSLRRLQTDYVDLFLIHWPDLERPLEEVAPTLDHLVQSGKTRAVGVSNFTGEQLRTLSAALTTTSLVTDQLSYHLFDQRWARSAFEACRELGIGVMAYGPLAHGLLAGAITRDTVFAADDWRASGMIFGQALLTPENRNHNLDLVDRLKKVAAGLGVTLPQLALAWVLAHDPVSVALVGARNEAEIQDGAAAADVCLSEDTLQEIDAIMAEAVGLSDVLPT
ncbi:MAG TPA: aldo/keto reductase [Thermomicrobiales bacterium]|nr:aldo/keto reductase [Thermomicrobiales bacterium]